MKRWILGLAVVVVVAVGWCAPSEAALTYYLGGDPFSYSGSSVNIENDALTVTIENVKTDVVQLTVYGGELPLTAKLNELYLNVDVGADTATLLEYLQFGWKSGEVADSIRQGYTKVGQDCVYLPDRYKADGDGKYDLLFSWPTDASDPNLFQKGSTSVYEISLNPGSGLAAGILNEGIFDAWSVEGGGAGAYQAAVHLNEVAAGSSGWYCPTDGPDPPFGDIVPEPAALTIWFVLGALGITAAWRRSRQ